MPSPAEPEVSNSPKAHFSLSLLRQILKRILIIFPILFVLVIGFTLISGNFKPSSIFPTIFPTAKYRPNKKVISMISDPSKFKIGLIQEANSDYIIIEYHYDKAAGTSGYEVPSKELRLERKEEGHKIYTVEQSVFSELDWKNINNLNLKGRSIAIYDGLGTIDYIATIALEDPGSFYLINEDLK